MKFQFFLPKEHSLFAKIMVHPFVFCVNITFIELSVRMIDRYNPWKEIGTSQSTRVSLLIHCKTSWHLFIMKKQTNKFFLKH